MAAPGPVWSNRTVADWNALTLAAADLAASIELRFAAHRHHVMATLRADGSPRLSGTEVYFHADDVWLGCMPGSSKALDLRRDPRIALHTAPIDIDMGQGDATIDGRAESSDDLDVWAAITEQDRVEVDELSGLLFRVEIERARLVRVEDGALIIESWSLRHGVRRRTVG